MARRSQPNSGRSECMLPKAISAALLKSIAPVAPDSMRAERMRMRIMEGIQIQPHPYATYHTMTGDGGTWIDVDAKLEMKILHKDSRATSFLLRLKLEAKVPSHVHAADEECLVLEGELRLAEGVTLRAGDHQFAPNDLPHGPAESPSGTLLFLHSEKPAY